MWQPGPEGFAAFFAAAEPRLRRALVASYGADRGGDAASEALMYGWQHWDRVREMENPVGYLFRVGQSRSRQRLRPEWPASTAVEGSPDWFEPGLPDALRLLSERERLAVVLVEGYGWRQREVAELADISPSSVQSYLERGLTKLRDALGVQERA